MTISHNLLTASGQEWKFLVHCIYIEDRSTPLVVHWAHMPCIPFHLLLDLVQSIYIEDRWTPHLKLSVKGLNSSLIYVISESTFEMVNLSEYLLTNAHSRYQRQMTPSPIQNSHLIRNCQWKEWTLHWSMSSVRPHLKQPTYKHI